MNRSAWSLVLAGLAMVLLGALWVSSSPVAMALVVMGASAAILGIVLNLAEGPVHIGPSGLMFSLRQRVVEMSVERKLSKEEAATAVATAKALERQSRAKREQGRVAPTPDEVMSVWLGRMTEAQELLGHSGISPDDRSKAESIVDAVAEDIVEEAPRRVKRRKKTRR